ACTEHRRGRHRLAAEPREEARPGHIAAGKLRDIPKRRPLHPRHKTIVPDDGLNLFADLIRCLVALVWILCEEFVDDRLKLRWDLCAVSDVELWNRLLEVPLHDE